MRYISWPLFVCTGLGTASGLIFKSNFLQYILVGAVLPEEKRDAISAVGRYHSANPEARVLPAFMYDLERLNGIFGKKIFQDHGGLCLAVRIRLVEQGDLNHVIKIAAQFIRIAGPQCLHHIVEGV